MVEVTRLPPAKAAMTKSVALNLDLTIRPGLDMSQLPRRPTVSEHLADLSPADLRCILKSLSDYRNTKVSCVMKIVISDKWQLFVLEKLEKSISKRERANMRL